MARPQHARPRESTPRTRVWLIVALLAAALFAIPATAQDAPTTCDYSQSHLHNGWGWNEDSEQSCAPAQGNKIEPIAVDSTNVEPSDVQPTAPGSAVEDGPASSTAAVEPVMVGTCDYSKSHHFDGYGWDDTNDVSCEPLLTTSTTEYTAPEPASPEDTCDYSLSHLHDGYGWDETNGISCEPMANRIATATRNDIQHEDDAEIVKLLAEDTPPAQTPPARTRPPAGSSPVHPDDWDGDGVADPRDRFPFDPSLS